MPSRNLLSVDVEDGYYHVYSRGVNSQTIFKKGNDYRVFLSLLKRYLSIEPVKDRNGLEYPHFYGDLEVLAYCLMPNHIHLMIYQKKQDSLRQLMHGVMLSYSKYFNNTYNRRGPLFESRYKASLIGNDVYLQHISRYIHLNPRDWRNYKYSSLPYFIAGQQAEWLKPKKIIELFDAEDDYKVFLEDYSDYKRVLDDVKHELAAL